MSAHNCKTDADLATCPACQENLRAIASAPPAEPEFEKELEVVVGEDGTLRFVYDDDLADLIPEGYTCPIQRASHVEPRVDGKWMADMRPAFKLMTEAQYGAWEATLPGNISPNDAAQLGPFASRSEALAEEVAWLKAWAGV